MATDDQQPCPNCGHCVQTCCLPRMGKPELVIGRQCVVAPGVYENVTVEIDTDCRVVRLEPSARIIVEDCDSCA